MASERKVAACSCVCHYTRGFGISKDELACCRSSRERDHANCLPGCHLHPELHHAGWVQSGTRRWHYFEPGMTISECGGMRIQDCATRRVADPGTVGCAQCRRVMASYAIKLREAADGE